MTEENKEFFETDFGKRVLRNRMNCLELNMPFIEVFGVRLKKFWEGNILGFDVIAFDKFIEPEENESTNDAILRKYGQEGLDIINKLLDIKIVSQN